MGCCGGGAGGAGASPVRPARGPGGGGGGRRGPEHPGLEAALQPRVRAAEAAVARAVARGDPGGGALAAALAGAGAAADAASRQPGGVAKALGEVRGAREAGRAGAPAASEMLDRVARILAALLPRPEAVRGVSEARRALEAWWVMWEALGVGGSDLRALLGPEGKSLWLYLAKHARCWASSSAEAAEGRGGDAAYEGEERRTFTCRRSAAFADAFRWASGADFPDPACLWGPAKVFPSFVAPDGHLEAGEGHGPRREFFKLCGSALSGNRSQGDAGSWRGEVDARGSALPGAIDAAVGPGRSTGTEKPAALFDFSRSMETLWINKRLERSQQSEAQFRFCGWLFAQAMMNRCEVGIDLHPLVLQKVCASEDPVTGLELLGSIDPEAARGIKKAAGMREPDFREMLALEGLDAAMSRADYQTWAARELLTGTVEWQVEALAAGFHLVLPRGEFARVGMQAKDLAQILRGPSGDGCTKLPLQKVFRVAADEDFKESGPEFILQTLFQIYEQWPLYMKRKFLFFVTASDRFPSPGSELLRVEVPFFPVTLKEHEKQLGMLPQAHTCNNTLELPNYWESLQALDKKASRQQLEADVRELLAGHLEMAVTECGEYGLDQIEGDDAPERPPPLPEVRTAGPDDDTECTDELTAIMEKETELTQMFPDWDESPAELAPPKLY